MYNTFGISICEQFQFTKNIRRWLPMHVAPRQFLYKLKEKSTTRYNQLILFFYHRLFPFFTHLIFVQHNHISCTTFATQ